MLAISLWLLFSTAQLEAGAAQTTQSAQKLVLERIEAINRSEACREAFERRSIDLARVRSTARTTQFLNAEGAEGNLRFSQAVGKPASPDATIRELAEKLLADAFVLGYHDGARYVRTRKVVLNRGYFRQGELENGTFRFTTPQEKQSLLLHEVLHIALDKDDDSLEELQFCPLRLLTLCPAE